MLPNYTEEYTLEKVNKEIANYNKSYPTPKWLMFVKKLLQTGWIVGVQKADTTFSKYVYIRKDKKRFKIRFSDHKPSRRKEMWGDADYYVGVSHLNCMTTEEVLKQVNKKILFD